MLWLFIRNAGRQASDQQLIETGRRQDVKAVWIKRILDAQRQDGGWDGVDVIAHLQDHLLACSDGRLRPAVMSQPESTFHPTAQGLYLLALLLKADP